MEQLVLNSSIKFTVSLTGAATLRAPVFQQRICTSVCVLVSGRSVAEQSSCRSAGRTSFLSKKLYLSVFLLFILSPICQSAFHCPSVPHFSSVVLLWSFCLSLVHSQPGSPLLSLPTPACLHRVSGHASCLLTLTGQGWFIHPLPTVRQPSRAGLITHTQGAKPAVTNLRFCHFVLTFAVESRFKNEARRMRKKTRNITNTLCNEMNWTALVLIFHHMFVKAAHSSQHAK